MLSSKAFNSDNSQVLRLLKEYRVNDKELYIHKIGAQALNNELILVTNNTKE